MQTNGVNIVNKQHLRAAAESFAGITDIESACYHYINDGFKARHMHILIRHYTEALAKRGKTNTKYISQVVWAALSELEHPCNKDTGWAWSGNDRAAFCGIPKATWSRNGLCESVNFVITKVRSNALKTSYYVRNQMNGVSNPLV